MAPRKGPCPGSASHAGAPGCRKCLSGERHPTLIFTYRKDDRLYCRNVKPWREAALRKAEENGRRLERLIQQAHPQD